MDLRLQRLHWLGTLAMGVVLLGACDDDTGDTSGSDAGDAGGTALRNVEIRFAPRVGNQPAGCSGIFAAVGQPASSVQLQDFRMYVSNLRLIDANGGEHPIMLVGDNKWQNQTTALLDFEDGKGACTEASTAETNMVVRGLTTISGETGLRFTMGVPFETNHQLPSSAQPPLSLGAMFWSWQAGYKFLRLDLTQTGAPGGNWLVHIGSTGCVSAGDTRAPDTVCGKPNRAEITLSPFQAATSTVIVDVGALLAKSNLASNTAKTAPGCMSDADDPECVTVLGNLGLDAPTGQCVNGCSGQTFFRVE